MKFDTTDKYVEGQTRTRRRFLLLPKWGDGEARWLESAEWEEIYHIDYDGWAGWEFWRWADKKGKSLEMKASPYMQDKNKKWRKGK